MDYLIRWFKDCIAVDMVILVIFHSICSPLRLFSTHIPSIPHEFFIPPVKSCEIPPVISCWIRWGMVPWCPHHRNWPWSCSIWPRSGRALLHLLRSETRIHDSHDMPGPYGPMGLKPSNYMKLWHFKSGLWHCGTGLYELLYRENPSKPLEPSGKYTKMAQWVYAKMARWVYNTSGFELLENRTHN